MIDKELIKDVSTKPGVYFWKDKDGNVIYVGKAKNLKSRMSQYFDKNVHNSFKTSAMLKHIASFDTTVFDKESEALMFERASINRYKPKYNVMLPSHNNYPYICIIKKANSIDIQLKNEYKKRDDIIYYGPVVDGEKTRLLIKYLVHLLKTQEGLIIKKMTPVEVDKRFAKAKEIIKFNKEFKQELISKIRSASLQLDFRRAEELKKILDFINEKNNIQNIRLKTKKSIDVWGVYLYDNILFASILQYRYSLLNNRQDFQFCFEKNEEELVFEFIENFYKNNPIPDQIIIDDKYKNQPFNKEIRNSIIKKNYSINSKLLDLASANAKNDLSNKIKKIKDKTKSNDILQSLKNILNIDCSRFAIFDNSFQSATKEVVGRGMIFVDGINVKKFNRSYILCKNEDANSDYHYMYQNISKFFCDHSIDEDINLIFVDGGEIQINAAIKALKKFHKNVPIFGLVKNNHHEFARLINDSGVEIKISDAKVFNFLSQIQYDVDKSAKAVYNKRHNKIITDSLLTKIKGVGPKIEQKLLEKFGSYQAIIDADILELSKIINTKIASEIKKIKI
ncbi:excinuclease ABC subunit UvrC [Mycoplasma sp. 332]|uniref:excinuclease ABC subunit UvrC n=1 Tax=Mycoplasma sp. 332 TaxID=3458236 RepID=UPI00403530E4